MKKYVSNSFINKSPLEYKNGTEAVTSLPVTIYTDGQPVSSYTIKGNTTTSGTPSPSNPITISGCGDKTANLFDINWWISKAVRRFCTATIANNVVTMTATTNDPQLGYATSSGGASIPNDDKAAAIEVEESTTYTLTLSSAPKCYVTYYDSSWNCLNSGYNKIPVTLNPTSYTFTTPADCKYITLRLGTDTIQSGETYTFSNIMLVQGSTAPSSYIPFGYKISISSNQQALTPMYLTEQLMKINDTVDSLVSDGTVTRALKKFVFDGTENDWQVASTTVGVRFNIPVPDINESTVNSPKSICSHFYLGTSSTDYGAYSISYAGSSVTKFICKPESTITTVAQLKQWLADQYAAGTPLTLWGIADSTTTETVTAPTIPTTGGTATIDVDTTVKPSELDLTYHGWHEHEPLKRENGQWS